MKNESDSALLFPARPSLGRNVLWVASVALIYFTVARLSTRFHKYTNVFCC